jgi:subtilase family serine protease
MVGFARCASWIRTDIAGSNVSGVPDGYGPADLQAAYGLTKVASSYGKGVTVAIMDAFDNPNIEADLQVYRKQYGLPVCNSSNGCFAKKNFSNLTSTGWGMEEELDVQMVSAICPNCKILLVEAANNDANDFATAEQYATAHANYVSNSWGAWETAPTFLDSSYQVSGKVITASSGDGGYNDSKPLYPADLPGVISVGGTTLSSINPHNETAWGSAGSQCSGVYPKPSFQSAINTGCSMRASADISAIADPQTGVAVYNTFGYSGWYVIGGTSVSAPVIASAYALSGNTNDATYLYAHTSSLTDIISGPSNGTCGAPLCTSGRGWDGPTGLGTPNGLGAL